MHILYDRKRNIVIDRERISAYTKKNVDREEYYTAFSREKMVGVNFQTEYRNVALELSFPFHAVIHD